MQEEGGTFTGLGFVGEEADVGIGMEAVDHACAGGHGHAQPFGADGHATIGADFERGAHAPDGGPPGAAWGRAQHAAFFALGGPRGGVGRALEFALDFVGVAVAVSGVVRVSAAKRAGRRPCQYGCGRSILPLAWGVRA